MCPFRFRSIQFLTRFLFLNFCRKESVLEFFRNPCSKGNSPAGYLEFHFSIAVYQTGVKCAGKFCQIIPLTIPMCYLHKRQSRITLKCDPSQPGNGTIPEFKEDKPLLYVITSYFFLVFIFYFLHFLSIVLCLKNFAI